MNDLTVQEKEIVRLYASGMMAKEVAWEMHLCTKTIRWHLNKIYKKLGIKNKYGLILYSVTTGKSGLAGGS